MTCRKLYKLLSLETAMATQSCALAWKIPGTEEAGRLQSMGSLGVGHDSGSLVGCHLWGCTESDTTEST